MRRQSLGIAALALSLLVLVLSGRAWLSVRRATPWSWVALQRAKIVEAKVAVTEIAWGAAQCAERSGSVVPTSGKVPASLGAINGQMYQSRLSDWDDEVFKCSGFHLHRPQRFQYQWVRGSGDEGGRVQADADFDGDGVVDHTVRLAVRCARDGAVLRCRPDPMPTEPFAPLLTEEWWE
jgi:hypothetical protein